MTIIYGPGSFPHSFYWVLRFLWPDDREKYGHGCIWDAPSSTQPRVENGRTTKSQVFSLCKWKIRCQHLYLTTKYSLWDRSMDTLFVRVLFFHRATKMIFPAPNLIENKCDIGFTKRQMWARRCSRFVHWTPFPCYPTLKRAPNAPSPYVVRKWKWKKSWHLRDFSLPQTRHKYALRPTNERIHNICMLNDKRKTNIIRIERKRKKQIYITQTQTDTGQRDLWPTASRNSFKKIHAFVKFGRKKNNGRYGRMCNPKINTRKTVRIVGGRWNC